MSFEKGDWRSVFPRVQKENMEANLAFVDLLNRVAHDKQVTTAQVALAWITAQRPWIVPIPGTTKIERMKENTKAAEVILSAAELHAIADGANNIEAKGTRYPETFMKDVDRKI